MRLPAALTVAGLLVLSMAFAGAKPGGPSAPAMLFPKGGEVLAGLQTIQWSVKGGGDVTIVLYANGVLLQPPLCGACSGSSFVFDTTAWPDGRYVVEVVAGSLESSAQSGKRVSSGPFAIDNTAPSTLHVLTAPSTLDGWYTGDVTVELLATDANLAGTYSSLDGADPARYAGSWRVAADGPHTLAYWSVDLAGNVEAAKAVLFRRDATAPDTGVTFTGPEGNAGWYRGALQVTVLGHDGASGVASTIASVDDAPWSRVRGPLAVGGDGDHVVRFQSTDAAGNVEAIDSVAFRIDGTPPATTATALGPPGLNGWYVGDVTVELRASDATSGVAATYGGADGAPAAPYTDAFRLQGDGAHGVVLWSVDVAGNAEPGRSFPVPIDGTPPASTIAVGEPQADGGNVLYVTSATPIALDARDATSGVGSIGWRVHFGPFSGYAGPFGLQGEDGAYFLEWRAVDVAGNEEAVQVHHFVLDNTPPDLAFAHPQAGGVYANGWLLETHPVNAAALGVGATLADASADTVGFAVASGDVEVVAATSDAGAGVREVRFYVDGQLRSTDATAPYSWTWATGQEALGVHALRVEGEDRLGNTSSRSLVVQVLPDPSALV